MISSLTEVLAYENDEIVHRFSEDFGVPPADSRDVFLETKRWLWLCARHRQAAQTDEGRGLVPALLPLINEAYAIDLMWHTFLLFTKDYAEFCERHFGFFVHHTPQTKSEKDRWSEMMRRDPGGTTQERKKSLRKVYEFIYDELGPEILVRWCEEFPRRYKDI